MRRAGGGSEVEWDGSSFALGDHALILSILGIRSFMTRFTSNGIKRHNQMEG